MAETQSNFCRHCGAQKTANATFCGNCGEPIGQNDHVAGKNEQGPLDSVSTDGLSGMLQKGVRHFTGIQEGKCKSCGTIFEYYVLGGVKDFCPNCSEFELIYADEKPTKPATVYCRLCGGKLFPPSKFCPCCGEIICEVPTATQETDYADFDNVNSSLQPAAQVEYQQHEYQQPQPAAQPQLIPQAVPQPDPLEDPIEKLAKLKKMVDAGLITEEDYNTKKTEILSKM
jgi:Short C-terminal domain